MEQLITGILNITPNTGTDEYVKCEKTISEEEDSFDCDLCDKTIHMSCAEGKKSKLKARKWSKCPEMYGTR